jgi:hypothetical protein
MARFWVCTHLCNHDVFLFFGALRNYGAFEGMRQRQPDKVSSDDFAAHLGQADAERDQLLVDGTHHLVIALAVRRLELLNYVTLELSSLHCFGHDVGR